MKEMKKMPRGSHSITTSSDNITITRWLDNNFVHVASMIAGAQPTSKAKRWCKRSKTIIEIDRPFSVELYNKHMGGVDLMDSLVALYPHCLRHKRWYFRIFHHLLNVLIVNAWILQRNENKEKMDLLEFKSSIATSLIYTGKNSSQKRGRPSSFSPRAVKKRVRVKAPTELRLDGGAHWPKKTDKSYASKCHLNGCKRKTVQNVCKRCNEEPLCPECFEDFHSRL